MISINEIIIDAIYLTIQQNNQSIILWTSMLYKEILKR